MLRRLIALILMVSLVLLPTALAENAKVRVGALKGPTAMGMVEMMRDKGDTYDFTLVSKPDEIVALLAKGELDVAAIPANLAAVLYQKIGAKVLAINTLGVLYIVERGDSIQSVADLKGRTLYVSGKGATPEYALNTILRGNGLDPENDLTIEFKSEHQECLMALLEDSDAIALLPQPFATVAQTTAEDLRLALDLTEEWDALQADAETPSTLITGVAVARPEFIDAQPEALAQFMTDYAASVAFTQDSPEEAAQLIGEYDIFQAEPALKALPYCNIVFIDGADMKGLLSGYLADLFAQEPSAVGGALPEEDFYYAAE